MSSDAHEKLALEFERDLGPLIESGLFTRTPDFHRGWKYKSAHTHWAWIGYQFGRRSAVTTPEGI